MKPRRVQVWVRLRPTQKFPSNMIQIHDDKKSISLHVPKDIKKGVVNNQVQDWSFKTDGIFNNVSQDDVYKTVASQVITNGLDGYNATIMCYGQTGSGKTFTMTGSTESFHNRGIVPRALSHLYRLIENDLNSAITVRVSYLEIYNEHIVDLLQTVSVKDPNRPPSPIVVAEDDKGVYVKGLNCHLAQSEEEALNLLFEGETNRTTAAHALNQRSSRSHCVFTIYLEKRSRLLSDAKYTFAKVNFVDLAGSERLQKTNSAGKIQTEASYINKSLSFLEQTVMALADKSREHVPFRQSKLTHYLKDSIGGSCKTILIANIWGEKEHLEETTSTLRFGSRMMRVASEPIENKQFDPSVLVLNLRKEIDSLKRELAMHDTLHEEREIMRPHSHRKNNRTLVTYDPLSEQQKYEYRQQVRKYVEGTLDELDIINIRQIQCVYDIFRDMIRNADKEAESRLRAQYPDGRFPAAGTVSGDAPKIRRPSEDDLESVGDIDARGGYGVGQAPRAALDENGPYLQHKRKDRKQTMTSPPKAPASRIDASRSTELPNDVSRGASEAEIAADSKEDLEKSVQVPSLVKITIAEIPTILPTRVEAFEEFKKDVGIEIHKILTENKEVLVKKKHDYSRLASQINSTKMEIDRSKLTIQSLKNEREIQGQQFTEEGEIIITEAEYLEISNLKELKDTYKSDYEELKTLKGQIHYCQKMVDLTRQRLIEEFDRYYTESFLDQEKVQPSSQDLDLNQRAGTKQPEVYSNYQDPEEKFDQVQRDAYANQPEALPYNRAKEGVVTRQVYQASHNQPQPTKKQPGTPTLNPRDQLPKSLEYIQG